MKIQISTFVSAEGSLLLPLKQKLWVSFFWILVLRS